MKGFIVLTARTLPITSFVRRRRRQASQRGMRSVMSLELAEAHVQALVAMAAADGPITSAEMDEVLAVADGFSLAAADRSTLHRWATQLLAAPPELEGVCDALSHVTIPPVRARVLAFDLARIAAVEGAGAPRELLLMERVCDVVGVSAVPLALRSDPAHVTPVSPRRRAIAVSTQMSIRESVIRALESSC